MAKTHPHIDSPSRAQLSELVKDRPDELAGLYLELHELVGSTLPEITSSVDTVDQAVGYAAHQYGYDGWGMLALTPFSRWVSLTFLQGSKLDDPSGLLTGSAVMRHAKLRSREEFEARREGIRALIVAASKRYTAAR